MPSQTTKDEIILKRYSTFLFFDLSIIMTVINNFLLFLLRSANLVEKE